MRRRGGKWTALIVSWLELRWRLQTLYDRPDVEFINAEIVRLRRLRTIWWHEQDRAERRARRAQRKAA